MQNSITLLTIEIEKIKEALIARQFTGGIIKIAEKNNEVTVRHKDDMLIGRWQRDEFNTTT